MDRHGAGEIPKDSMRKILGATATILAVAIPATQAEAARDRADCGKKLERKYSSHYKKVAKRHGTRAPGRNIRKYGVLFKGNTFDATCGEIKRSNRQLVKLLIAPPIMYSRNVPPPQPPAGVQSDFNVAALPACTWVPESGGNYNAVNPSSGAYGKYQIMPMHWNGGVCTGLGRDPSGQEQCAARIYASSGAGAWVNC